ncbi:hypothetical protein V492_08480 [Pseudogymnoascus sp. VKM F-4246]|nr:hypothetical protein V492_08480 [Pseudogymnoascus sp. VKM F-4246]
MVLISPRIQFYEITDQPWFPEYFLRMVQSCLTVAWNFRMPIMQKHSPAQCVSSILLNTLDKSVTEYTYVDFCAGAGGPTPFIERELNQKLGKAKSSSERTGSGATNIVNGEPYESVKFVMTDLHPHISEWKEACNKSKNLTFVPKPVDATNAPADLILDDGKKVFRMFNLAFHHFDDNLGRKILKNTLETSDGFGIFELSDRTPSSLLMISLMGFLATRVHSQLATEQDNANIIAHSMEQEADPGTYHAHTYYAAPHSALASVPLLTIPRPFRLCNVSIEERATWCMQTAYELALLKNAAFHYGDAYEKVVTAEETKLLLTNIIEMNSKGRSTLAVILEAMCALMGIAGPVDGNEYVSLDALKADRSILMGDNSLMEKIAETQELIAETEQRLRTVNALAQTWSNAGGPEILESFPPEQELLKIVVEGGLVMQAETNVVESEEEASTYATGSDNNHNGTETPEDAVPVKTVAEERTPRSLRRPQFGTVARRRCMSGLLYGL